MKYAQGQFRDRWAQRRQQYESKNGTQLKAVLENKANRNARLPKSLICPSHSWQNTAQSHHTCKITSPRFPSIAKVYLQPRGQNLQQNSKPCCLCRKSQDSPALLYGSPTEPSKGKGMPKYMDHRHSSKGLDQTLGGAGLSPPIPCKMHMHTHAHTLPPPLSRSRKSFSLDGQVGIVP